MCFTKYNRSSLGSAKDFINALSISLNIVNHLCLIERTRSIILSIFVGTDSITDHVRLILKRLFTIILNIKGGCQNYYQISIDDVIGPP